MERSLAPLLPPQKRLLQSPMSLLPALLPLPLLPRPLREEDQIQKVLTTSVLIKD